MTDITPPDTNEPVTVSRAIAGGEVWIAPVGTGLDYDGWRRLGRVEDVTIDTIRDAVGSRNVTVMDESEWRP